MRWSQEYPPRRGPAPVSTRLRGFVAVAVVPTLLSLTGCGHKSPTAPMPLSNEGEGIASVELQQAARATDGQAVHLEGVSGPGALWRIDKPANWNGDLVVYLHGYTDPAQDVSLPNAGAIIDALVARGYAVAASSFSENGYAVKDGVIRSHQLSGIFASNVGKPRRTFLFGQSMGGLIGLLLAQKYPGQYEGGLLVCGVVGGTDDEIQYLGDVRVLFDAVYPGVLSGDLEHPPVITNLNAQVVGPVVQAVTANPQGLGVIQSLARRPLAGATGDEVVTSLLNALIFGLQGGGDLLDRAHGHTYFDNAGWRYTSPVLPAALVEDINARVARYDATPDAEAYMAHYGEPSGGLAVPVLSLHTSRDPVVPVFHEDLLKQAAAGPMLLQRRAERYGHCTFTVAELMDHFATVIDWADTGHKPAS